MNMHLPEWTFAGANVDLEAFVRESNRIEGIKRTTTAQIEAHYRFLCRPQVQVQDLVDLVAVLQPNARLRDSAGVPGVRVGNHIAPPSGSHIAKDLIRILNMAGSSYHQHVAYETLHPFTDGNGRSGRALWLHRRGAFAPLGFLHHFYYQTLEHARPPHRTNGDFYRKDTATEGREEAPKGGLSD